MTRLEWLQAKATVIGTVCGVTFYEDPDHGDEVGLWAVYQGATIHTDWYDLPREEDILDHGSVAAFMDIYS